MCVCLCVSVCVHVFHVVICLVSQFWPRPFGLMAFIVNAPHLSLFVLCIQVY